MYYFLLTICLSLGPMLADAGDVRVGGSITGRVDRISGPGNTVVQHADGSATYYKCGAGNKKTCVVRNRSRQNATKAAISRTMLCSTWNKQWKAGMLKYENGKLYGKGTTAISIVAYIQGLMRARHVTFDRGILNRVDNKCKSDHNQPIADAILLKR
ncbi:hypothetical protein TI04_11595 [Achromatium sp. WMS2]|nr:hypothetical protein TI04_11595 [Achromatium sp. WMS2]